MEISNDQKKSLCMSLAILAGDLSITRYNLPRFGNENIYNIKSIDGELDYIIDFIREKDYSEALASTIAKILKKYSGNKRIPTIDELLDDDLALKKIAEIYNYIKTEIPSLDEMSPELHRIIVNMSEFCNLGEESNYLNDEIRVTADAVRFIDVPFVQKVLNEKDLADKADLVRAIDESNKEYTIYRMDLAQQKDWTRQKRQETIDVNLEKKIAKVFTLLAIYEDLTTDFDTDSQMSNFINLKTMFDNGEFFEFNLHNRALLGEDLDKFADKIYTEILNHSGYINVEDLKPNQRESLAVSIIQNSVTDPKFFLNNYIKASELGVYNFGRDSRIMNAVALNVIATMGAFGGLVSLENIGSKGSQDIEKIFNYHYMLASSDSLRAVKIIREMINNGEFKINTHMTFEEYINRKYPGMFDIQQISGDELDSLADMLGEIFRSMGNNSQEGYFHNEDEDADDGDFCM